MTRLRRATTGIGLAAIATLASISSPAFASSTTTEAAAVPQVAPWTCDKGYICLYEKVDGQGKRCQYKNSHNNIGTGRYPCRKNNKTMTVKSAYNRSANNFSLYSGAEYKGTMTPIAKTKKVHDIPKGVLSIRKR